MRNLKEELYHTHSENIPSSLLTCAGEEDRKFAVDKILTLGIGKDQGRGAWKLDILGDHKPYRT